MLKTSKTSKEVDVQQEIGKSDESTIRNFLFSKFIFELA